MLGLEHPYRQLWENWQPSLEQNLSILPAPVASQCIYILIVKSRLPTALLLVPSSQGVSHT